MENKLFTTKNVSNILKLSSESIRHYPERYKIGHKLARDWFFSRDDIMTIYKRMKKSKKEKVDKSLIKSL